MAKGKPFRHVVEEAPLPDLDEIRADSQRARDEDFEVRVFSEMFLYPRVGKGDARFILGIADEYEHVIEALGPKAVRAILNVQPRLVQRLGTGGAVVESLADAQDEQAERREEDHPAQVILDADAMGDVWRLLHNEYVRYFNPEKDMDPGPLRTYHYLTDALGTWYREQRQEERDRLPEKLAKQTERREARREARAAAREEGRGG